MLFTESSTPILDPDLIPDYLFIRMVTYDEGDYYGGQEDGRPQGHGKMIYSENDPLGRLVIMMMLEHMSTIMVAPRLSYEGNWEAGQPSGQGCMKFRLSFQIQIVLMEKLESKQSDI